MRIVEKCVRVFSGRSLTTNKWLDTIRKKKADLYEKLCNNKPPSKRPDLLFFDAQTHPLGSPNIKIQDN